MANIKSQIKRNRTNEQARLRNKATKSSLKTAVKKFRTAVESGDVDAATAALKDASRDLDKAASKGIIHKNQAANRKSAMGRSLSASATKAPAPAKKATKSTRATKATKAAPTA